MNVFGKFRVATACGCVLATGLASLAHGVQLGNMQADKILFLGNSITTCQQEGTTLMWGLSASEPAKDYVHLLANRIDAATGGSLTLIPTIQPTTDEDGNILQNGSNVVNICGVFEWNYASYTSAKIATQLAWKPNIVVLQFGENMDISVNTTNAEVFESSLRTLMNDLKASSNPEIFVTSYIIGAPEGAEIIKRRICGEDPTHRTFVDLSDVFQDANNVGAHNHPSDAGMAVIADTLFAAMQAHAVPEPSAWTMLSAVIGGACCCALKQRKQSIYK